MNGTTQRRPTCVFAAITRRIGSKTVTAKPGLTVEMASDETMRPSILRRRSFLTDSSPAADSRFLSAPNNPDLCGDLGRSFGNDL